MLADGMQKDDGPPSPTSDWATPWSWSHLAGRRYPVAFQAIEGNGLVVGNERAIQLHRAHPGLGWAAIQELSASYLNDLETELASYAFGSLPQRLAAHPLTRSLPNTTALTTQPSAGLDCQSGLGED